MTKILIKTHGLNFLSTTTATISLKNNEGKKSNVWKQVKNLFWTKLNEKVSAKEFEEVWWFWFFHLLKLAFSQENPPNLIETNFLEIVKLLL